MIRPVELGELPGLLDLIRQGSAEVEESFGSLPLGPQLEHMVEAAVERGDPIFVAVDGDDLVGFCAWVAISAEGIGALGTWVHPEHRKKGLSRGMRRAATDYWRSQGARWVSGAVAKGNEPGLLSALNAGFRVSGYEIRMDLGV